VKKFAGRTLPVTPAEAGAYFAGATNFTEDEKVLPLLENSRPVARWLPAFEPVKKSASTLE